MPAPRNLGELKAVPGLQDRVIAAINYVAEREAAIREAKRIRDDALAELLANGAGVTATARATGMSVSHVKNLKPQRASTRA